nr:hypothetical protein [Microbulbifer rhizosphaerae]
MSLPGKYLGEAYLTIEVFDESGLSLFNSPVKAVISEEEKNKVLFGNFGWLFLKNDSNRSLDYLTGKIKSPENLCDLWERLCVSRKEKADKLGADLVTLVAPEKEVCCQCYLPEGYVISDSRPLRLLTNHFYDKREIKFCVPDFSGIEEGDLYFKGDTHWTFYAAYLAFLEVLKVSSLSEVVSVSGYEEFKHKNSYQASDLLVKTDAVNIEKIKHVSISGQRYIEVYNNKKVNTGRRQEYLNTSPSNFRVMVWHSSSMDWMKPFVIDAFKNSCFVWGQRIDWDEVARYSPDLLIVQTRERFIVDVPSDF